MCNVCCRGVSMLLSRLPPSFLFESIKQGCLHLQKCLLFCIREDMYFPAFLVISGKYMSSRLRCKQTGSG
jgi:hypothetical protein